MTFCAKWNARKSVKGFTVNKTTAIFADTLSVNNINLKYCTRIKIVDKSRKMDFWKYVVAGRIMVISS